jgi:hypothetical protein
MSTAVYEKERITVWQEIDLRGELYKTFCIKVTCKTFKTKHN